MPFSDHLIPSLIKHCCQQGKRLRIKVGVEKCWLVIEEFDLETSEQKFAYFFSGKAPSRSLKIRDALH